MPIGADDIYDIFYELINPIIPISADYAGQIPLPFARYIELGEDFEHMTRGAGSPNARQIIVHAEFQLSIFAAEREQCRQFGRQIMGILDDYTAQYIDGRLMYIEPRAAIFIPEPRTAPGSPTVFHRAITFRYNEQRTL